MKQFIRCKAGLFTVCLVVIMAICISGCMPSWQVSSQQDGDDSQPQTKTLTFMLNSPEMTEQYNELVQAYSQHRCDIVIDMEIRQNDYIQVLKTKINAGTVPDLFLTSAYNDNKVYKNYVYNLANEDFIKEIEPAMLAGVTVGDSVTGVPLLVQSHSFIYNKKLFEQAGIKSLPTTLDEYEAVCRQLKAAGITPFSTGFADWWVLPQIFYPSSSDIAGGDYGAFFAGIKSGSKSVYDFEEISFALDVLDLITRYGGDAPMQGGFDQQCQDFAAGKVAIIHQGIWAEQTILDLAPDIELGYLYAPRRDGKGVIAVDSNLTFRVYKDSEMLDETLAFLDWLFTSEYGRSWIPERVKQISPLIDAKMPDTQLSVETGKAICEKKTSPWWIFSGPENIEQPLGMALQDYVAGRSTRAETLRQLNRLFGGNGAAAPTESALQKAESEEADS